MKVWHIKINLHNFNCFKISHIMINLKKIFSLSRMTFMGHRGCFREDIYKKCVIYKKKDNNIKHVINKYH